MGLDLWWKIIVHLGHVHSVYSVDFAMNIST